MDKKILDNMSGQELKEMIDEKIITLDDLDNTALEKIMNYEIDMLCFGSGDMTTVRRCSELLNERNDSEVLNKDSIISIIDKAQQEHIIIVDEEETYESKAKVIKKHSIVLRRIGLVAAILILMIVTTTFVAAAFGVNVFECISKIVRQDEGSQMIVDDVTFYHNGEAKQYSSVEELIAEENLDIMYPTKWPDGIHLTSVRISNEVNKNGIVQLFTNDSNVGVNIELYAMMFDSKNSDIYEYNNITFYIKNENNIVVSYCHYKNNTYYFTAECREDIILIINNMKG